MGYWMLSRFPDSYLLDAGGIIPAVLLPKLSPDIARCSLKRVGGKAKTSLFENHSSMSCQHLEFSRLFSNHLTP